MKNMENNKKIIIEIMNEDAENLLYKRKTAVEWLIEQIEEKTKNGTFCTIDYMRKHCFSKAKEMEKQQIMETAINCFCEGKYSAEYTEQKISSSELIKYAEEYFEQIYHAK